MKQPGDSVLNDRCCMEPEKYPYLFLTINHQLKLTVSRFLIDRPRLKWSVGYAG